MSEPLTETVCSDCGHSPARYDDYCSSCGAKDPWEEQYVHDFENVNFPVIIEWEMYNDDYELWREFCYQVFGDSTLTGDQIANTPDGLPKMKYACPMTYWKITESDVKGPYLSRQEAREA